MLVYDLIPERLGLDMSDPVWEEKRRAIEHASAYVCISENTRRDLLELEPAAPDKPVEVVLLGVDDFSGLRNAMSPPSARSMVSIIPISS